MKNIFGILLALAISTQVMAYEQQGSPPFDSFVCAAGNIRVQVKLQNFRQTHGAGPASVSSIGESWLGGWNWQPAKKETRLSGYHFLTVKANSQNRLGAFLFRVLYTPYMQLSGGWLEMPGFSGAINCQIVQKSQISSQCRVSPTNDCSVSPKRLCCDCIDGRKSCY